MSEENDKSNRSPVPKDGGGKDLQQDAQKELIENAFEYLSEESKAELAEAALKGQIELNNKFKEIAIKEDSARRDAQNHIQEYNELDKSNKLHSHKVTSEFETGVGTRKIESKSGTTCYVATLCYGKMDHPDVILLRNFRDNVLRKKAWGRHFIAWYYRNSPRMVRSLRNRGIIKFFVKLFVASIVWIIRTARLVEVEIGGESKRK